MADANVSEVEHVAGANPAEVQPKRIEALREIVRAVIDVFCAYNLEISILEVRVVLQELADDIFVGAEG
jgi:hypothetical protein